MYIQHDIHLMNLNEAWHNNLFLKSNKGSVYSRKLKNSHGLISRYCITVSYVFELVTIFYS